MAETSPESKEKKSQKRKDRQLRKAERRKIKAEKLIQLNNSNTSNNLKNKPVKARLSKKSLPGFLAKNCDAILQWLEDYRTLFIMADDYGIYRLDRLPPEKRQLLVQNYVDVSDFISQTKKVKIEYEKNIEQNSLSCEVN